MVSKEEYLATTAAALSMMLLKKRKLYPSAREMRVAVSQAVEMAKGLWYETSKEGQAASQVDVA